VAAPTRIQVAANIGATGSATGNQSIAAANLNLAQTGDLIVWCAAGRGTATAPPASGTGGQTWTVVFDGDGNPRAYSMYRATFNGTWSGDPTSTGAPGTTTIEISVWRATNSGVTWSHEIISGPSGVGAAATNTMVGGTPSGSDPVVNIGYVQTADDNSYGNRTGTGWDWVGSTSGYANTGGSDNSLATLYRADAAATATGSPTIDQTANGNDAYTRAVVCFKAAGGTPPPADDKIDTLVEDFASGLPATLDDSSSGTGSAVVTGGALVLTPGNTVGQVTSADVYDLDESSVYWQVEMSDGAGTDVLFLGSVRDAEDDGYAIAVGNGAIDVLRYVGGTPTSIFTDTYSPTNHRQLRIREASGTIYFEASPASVSWSTLDSEATNTNGSFDHTNVTFRLQNLNDGSALVTATIEGINTALGGATGQPTMRRWGAVPHMRTTGHRLGGGWG
jgi:hypothetical protein